MRLRKSVHVPDKRIHMFVIMSLLLPGFYFVELLLNSHHCFHTFLPACDYDNGTDVIHRSCPYPLPSKQRSLAVYCLCPYPLSSKRRFLAVYGSCSPMAHLWMINSFVNFFIDNSDVIIHTVCHSIVNNIYLLKLLG